MKIQKHQAITILLGLYALFMTFYFGIDLLKEGQTIRFWATFIIEIAVITLAYFALRKRDQYKIQRKRETKDLCDE